ncbi:hypothetical protein P167DRAFT_288585 [Morchella conica CCBAS932]|uniref:Uncharacterized protein n=1 Tax=Morchella conica CCBAS932 TaxID=1392247 RepID=A0A3N4KH66_9PEZI|nr:hypothetical protein P167DRAFT_288585 [Morchella conica CCBAS932]
MSVRLPPSTLAGSIDREIFRLNTHIAYRAAWFVRRLFLFFIFYFFFGGRNWPCMILKTSLSRNCLERSRCMLAKPGLVFTSKMPRVCMCSCVQNQRSFIEWGDNRLVYAHPTSP